MIASMAALPAITPTATDPVGGSSSRHAGGANFGFADGHVTFLRSTMSPNILQRYLNRKDGELILDPQ